MINNCLRPLKVETVKWQAAIKQLQEDDQMAEAQSQEAFRQQRTEKLALTAKAESLAAAAIAANTREATQQDREKSQLPREELQSQIQTRLDRQSQKLESLQLSLNSQQRKLENKKARLRSESMTIVTTKREVLDDIQTLNEKKAQMTSLEDVTSKLEKVLMAEEYHPRCQKRHSQSRVKRVTAEEDEEAQEEEREATTKGNNGAIVPPTKSKRTSSTVITPENTVSKRFKIKRPALSKRWPPENSRSAPKVPIAVYPYRPSTIPPSQATRSAFNSTTMESYSGFSANLDNTGLNLPGLDAVLQQRLPSNVVISHVLKLPIGKEALTNVAETPSLDKIYQGTPNPRSLDIPSSITSSPKPQLVFSPELAALASMIVLPRQWNRERDENFRHRLMEAQLDALERRRPEAIMNTIANGPLLQKFTQYGCWQRCVLKLGVKKDQDPEKQCNTCIAKGVDCIYFTFVDGIVTQKGEWKDGALRRGSLPIRDSVNGKRWHLLYRQP